MCKKLAVVDPGFVSGGVNSKGEGANLICWQIFLENCMKTKTNWTPGVDAPGASCIYLGWVFYTPFLLQRHLFNSESKTITSSSNSFVADLYRVADPREGVRMPSRPKILHFRAVFGKNNCQIIGWHPFGVGALVWEILDLPLIRNRSYLACP